MDRATVKKAMEATVQLLGRIAVPVALYDSIGVPIMTAINNLNIGLEALEAEPDGTAEAAEAAKENADA